jgi:hypothetical protein
MPYDDTGRFVPDTAVPDAATLDALVVRKVPAARWNDAARIIHEATGLTLKESSRIIETPEAIECADEAEAKKLKIELERAGATATLESTGEVEAEVTKPAVFTSLGLSVPPATATEQDLTPPNPVGAGLVLLGAVLVLIGSFTPVHSFGTLPIYKNSFVQDGDWWLLVVAVAMGVTAVYFLMDATSGRLWRVVVPSVIAVGAGIYGQTTKFQTLELNSYGQQLFNTSSVKASAAIGVYLVLAGGILGLVGAGLLSGKWRPVGVPEYGRATKKCPDCAETVLADANVCKHCGYRFDRASGTA